MRKVVNVLVTGGAGFIGTNFIRILLTKMPEFTGRIINFDALTYAGNLAGLEDINREFGGTRYFFEQGDICNAALVQSVF
jgi:dTDP-glucose 4,6-dehydratase